MSRLTRLLAALLVSALALPALADDAILGSWELARIGESDVEGDRHVAYDFGADTVRVTIRVAGASQTWELGYTVSGEGELTIQPGEGLGEPSPMVYTYRVEEGELVLEVDGFGAEVTLRRPAPAE